MNPKLFNFLLSNYLFKLQKIVQNYKSKSLIRLIPQFFFNIFHYLNLYNQI